MGFFDKNISEREAIPVAAAGAIAFIFGIFILISSFMGLVVCAVGMLVFVLGYRQWDPFKAFKIR